MSKQEKLIYAICNQSKNRYNKKRPPVQPQTEPDPTIDWEAYSKTRKKLVLPK